MAKYPKRTLSKQEKGEIRALIGGNSHAVAEQYKCTVQQITGIWNSLRNNLGHHSRPLAAAPDGMTQVLDLQPLPAVQTLPESEELPPQEDPGAGQEFPPEDVVQQENSEVLTSQPLLPPHPEATPMTQPRQNAPRTPAAPVAPSPAEGWFGFNVIAQAPGLAGSYVSPVQQLPTFQIERIAPPDGYLGSEIGNFDPNLLGANYGGGVYRVKIRVPGRPEVFADQRISEGVYGPAKYPKATPTREEDRDPRAQAERERTYGHEGRQPFPPGYRPGYDHPYYYPPRAAGPSQDSQAATEAIKQMGTLQQTAIAEISKARQSGPETFIADFYRTQSSEAQRIRDEERVRDENRRSEEREREETRRNDERVREEKRRDEDNRHRDEDRREREAQWQRDKEAEKVRHDREMERLRTEQALNKERTEADRKALLEIEEQKRNTLERELKSRHEAFLAKMEAESKTLQGQTKLSEDTLKAALARNQKDMEQVQRSVTQEMKDATERSNREFELRKENLDTQQKLLMEKLELEKQIATAHTAEGVVRGLQSILGEVGKRFESLIELKKMELGYKNPPGNVTDIPQTQKQPRTEPGAPGSAGQGTEETQESPENEEPKDMEQIISECLKDPSMRNILTEWTRQVAKGVPPSAFASFFVEAMSADDSPVLRRATKGLDMFMRTKDWPEMLKTLEPHLTAPEKEIFKTEAAALYYEAFRDLVAEEVDAYWEMVAQRRAARAGMREDATGTSGGNESDPSK